MFLEDQLKILRQMVFDNLLRNASKFAEGKVIVTISVRSEGDKISITVNDNGPGIPKEIQSDLFKKGVSTTGGGHGLYLTKKVIEGYGGTIQYNKDDRETGTSFTILLPSKS